MTDDHKIGRLKTRVVSDGNGGLELKEPFLETLRKWSGPALLGLLVWFGQGAVRELVALHDGQIRLEARIINVAEDAAHASEAATAAFASAAESLVQSEANAEALKLHDEWGRKRSDEIDHEIRILKSKGGR